MLACQVSCDNTIYEAFQESKGNRVLTAPHVEGSLDKPCIASHSIKPVDVEGSPMLHGSGKAQKVTITQLAAAAQVSKSTVSLVLNGKDHAIPLTDVFI